MRAIDERVVNLDELELHRMERGTKYACDGVSFAGRLGARDLGYSYDVVPPGKRACPFHSHRSEEELFFIVRGRGLLRYGSDTRPIRAGDVICCPTGGPETAHQIVNDSDEPLAYLSISTKSAAEICEYPDSGKVGCFSEGLRHVTKAGDHVDYWTDEAC